MCQRIATYDAVAAEYYDPVRHPTCANFAELSSQFLNPRLRKYATAPIDILEIGAGRSTVAPILSAAGLPVAGLTLLDKSAAMLQHSRHWAERGARLVVDDACAPQLPPESFGLIVASLGDPYNCRSFWKSTERLLQPRGICLFTIPAREWAERFRRASALSLAEFALADGNTVLVRSKIPPLDEQIRLVTEAGLQVIETQGLAAAHLSGPRSAKLLVTAETAGLPIVHGLVAQKA